MGMGKDDHTFFIMKKAMVTEIMHLYLYIHM